MITNAQMPSLPPFFAHPIYANFTSRGENHGFTSNLQPSSGLDFFAHSLGRKSPNLECFPTPLRSFDVQPPGDTTQRHCRRP